MDYASHSNMGGDIQVAFELSRELAAMGHDVTVFGGSEEPEYNITWRGVRLVSFRYDPSEPGALSKFKAVGSASAERFKKVFTGEKPFDVAAFHQPLVSHAFKSGGLLGNAKRVYFFHSPWSLEFAARSEKKRGLGFRLGSRLRRKFERRALEPAGVIITLSEYMKNLAHALHRVDSARVRVIPGGADTETFKPADDVAAVRRELGVETDGPVFFCLRRLVPRMGIDSLVAAMPSVVGRHPAAMLLVGGRGPMLEALKQNARALGVERNVRFLGYIDDCRVPKYYAAADASVVPTRELEGFGLVLLESLACGTPALATPVGGMTEILKPFRPQWLFKSTSPEDVSAGLLEFLSSGGASPDARLACRELVLEKYAWTRAAEEVEKVFLEL